MQTKKADFSALWSEELRRVGIHQTVTRSDEQRLRQEAAGLTPAQFAWAVRQYLPDTIYPTVSDLFDYLGGVGQLPTDAGARAALSGSPYVERLGEELEDLLGAWFPTQETRLRCAELEARIKEAT